MARWWVEDPARWQLELDALDSAGLDYNVVGADGHGVLSVRVRRQHDGKPIELLGTYPSSYPFFPPVVELKTVHLKRHHTPGSGRLCLLGQDGNQWKPATDTLAWLLTTQWDRVLRAQPGPEQDTSVESGQAEPITAYLDYEKDSFVGVPELPAGRNSEGTFRIALDSLKPLRGTVLEWLGSNGESIVRSDVRDISAYPAGSILTGRWVRLEERLDATTAQEFFEAAVAVRRDLELPRWQELPAIHPPRIDLVALTFPDELSPGMQHENVVLLAKTQLRTADGRRDRIQLQLHRAELESRRLYGLRDPLVATLAGARVAVAGLGSIGSPLARYLAQSGVGHLNLVDHDILEAGNAVRWEAGRALAGKYKVQAMVDVVANYFPLTKVQGLAAKIGDAGNDATPTQSLLNTALFHQVDCIVDASAARNVNHYLSEEARRRRIPYVWLYATNGAWGGAVAVVEPRGGSPCWMCYQYYLDDGTVRLPPAAPETDMVHPPQCLDPTFTGSQMDLAEVSLMAARLTTSQIRSAQGGDADYAWNFATLSLRDVDGKRTLPAWTPYQLAPHAQCPYHRAVVADE